MDSTENAHVEFERVCKSYDGRVQVVRDLDLTVYEGEFLTLLGASGSGKTTCLMMLAGFEPLTSGTISIHGHSVHDLPPRKRGIGVVFQNYALFPHMTVGGNLAFPLEVRGLDPQQRRERVRRATGGRMGRSGWTRWGRVGTRTMGLASCSTGICWGRGSMRWWPTWTT